MSLTKNIKAFGAETGWTISLPFFVATALVLVTSTFHDTLNVPAAGWQMLYIIILIASLAYTIYSLSKRQTKPPISVETLVERCLTQCVLANTKDESLLSQLKE